MLSFFYLDMAEVDITKERSLLNWAQIGALLTFACITTWTASKIHSRFEIMEKDHQIEQELGKKDRATDKAQFDAAMKVISDRVEYVDDRIDKKFNQLKEQYHND